MTALLGRVDAALWQALPGVEWVTGEVSEPNVTPAWARCTLLQPAGEDLAVLQAFVAPEHLRRIRREVAPRPLEEMLAAGRTVTVGGRIRRSGRTGKIELRVERLALTTGEGLLARRRRETEARLRAEGLLDRQRERHHLPVAPLRVALVSGWDSDGLDDARRVLADSGYQFACKSYQERLEGPGAPKRIARALGLAAGGGNQTVLLVRGGGPGTALSPFDAEPVARAIAGASVPVLTGIGHQRHHTLADAAAHRACITPTGAAEAVVRKLRQAETRLDQAAARALGAAEAARRHRRIRWRRVCLTALAAVAVAVASPRLPGWPLPLALAVAVGGAVAIAVAALAARRVAPVAPGDRLPPGARPPEDRRGGPPLKDGPLPESVDGVIAALDDLATALSADGGAAMVGRATVRVHDLHAYGRQLLRGRSPDRIRKQPIQQQRLAPPGPTRDETSRSA